MQNHSFESRGIMISFKTSTHMWPVMEDIRHNKGHIYISYFKDQEYLGTIKVTGDIIKLRVFDSEIATKVFEAATDKEDIQLA